MNYGGQLYTPAGSTAVSSDYTVLDSDIHLMVNTSAARAITLPDPVKQRVFWIKDVTGLAETNYITLVRFDGEQIEGIASNRILQAAFGNWEITSDGTNYWITGV